MKIYNYNEFTGEYLSVSQADESPLEEGVFLIPAFATELKPPEAKENEAVCFENGDWAVKPDFRGKTYFDTELKYIVIIDFIGAIPENLVNYEDYQKTTEYIAEQAKKAKEGKNAEIPAKIQEIETKKIRALTDFVLSGDNTYLLRYEAQIADLRTQLEEL